MIEALLTDISSTPQSYQNSLNGFREEVSVSGRSFTDYLERLSDANSRESRRTTHYDRPAENFTPHTENSPRSETEEVRKNVEESRSEESSSKANAEKELVVKDSEGKEVVTQNTEKGDRADDSILGGERSRDDRRADRVKLKKTEKATSGESEKLTGAHKNSETLELRGEHDGQGKESGQGEFAAKVSQGENAGRNDLSGKGISEEFNEIKNEKDKIARSIEGELKGENTDVSAGYAAETGRIPVLKETRELPVGKSEISENSGKNGIVSEGKQSISAEAPKHTIVDLRSHDGKNQKQVSSEGQRENIVVEGRFSPVSDQKLKNSVGNSSSGSEQNESRLQVMQVHLKSDSAQGTQFQDSRSTTRGDLQNQLSQQLKEQLNGEIVKRSSILVRNNGSGEIKLELKPEQLGNVRIRISLENNNIAGKIFVETSSVKEAFDQNMQHLYRAFKEHGFGDAALNVSVGDHRQRQRHGSQTELVQDNYRDTLRSAVGMGGDPVIRTGDELRLVDVMA